MKRINNISGSSFVITAISFVVILGFTSLVTDIGLTLYERQKLANALDAAALAGAQNVNKGDWVIRNAVNDYAELNGVSPDDLEITITEGGKSIEVQSKKQVQYFFAKVLGINEKTITLKSTAQTAPVTNASGIRPLAVQHQTFEFGKQYALKVGAGDSYSGNYGAIALGKNGASKYEDNLINGYSIKINVGDEVFTETGNIVQPTRRGIQHLIDSDPYSDYNNFKSDSERVIILPVVNTLDVSGKKPIYVLGFAAFFLEEIRLNGGHTEVVGRFVRHVSSGDSSSTGADYGLVAVKLVK